ncbi:MAG: hypothetical protein K0S03_1928 [Burkholderiales bacterium]|jgi:hypothetical protein|nr:hypothetical protein [Burkholderiales bacterium]
MKAWQCIGCGRLESSQPCVGICEDRPVELVYAWQLVALLRQLAWSKPREGEWERSFRDLQARARKLLAA